MEISCCTDNILAKKINTLKQMAKIEKKLCTVDKALKRRGFAYCAFLASEIKIKSKSSKTPFQPVQGVSGDVESAADDLDAQDLEEYESPPQR